MKKVVGEMLEVFISYTRPTCWRKVDLLQKYARKLSIVIIPVTCRVVFEFVCTT